MNKEIEMYNTIEEGFRQYAGAVLQSRALVDVRDCLKPSARQIFYCLYTDKFTSDKPYKKVLKMIGSIARIYIHGDSSAEGIIMRAGQSFAMRYPLVSVKGNGGNLTKSGNWAAPRYPDAKLSYLTDNLFADLKKDTILEWRDNYDDTEQYPSVLPSKGFYNIVNGTMGIGIGAASSIPAFNLNDVNKALIHLLWNPDCDFEDIYCAPDFATGAILLNEEEVKESLKNGTGFACKLRAVIDYDAKERVLIVKEIPYGVYTNTICKELEDILNGDENPGIDRFNDLTGEKPLIKIYLKRNASPEKVLRYLYKKTSLQSHYGINMTMLKDGRFPQVFGWKAALTEHLLHEKEVYIRGFNFDLKKIKARLHIVEGIIIALNNIEEVVELIKKSSSTTAASKNLQDTFGLTEAQAKAILDIKLARLAHLETQKFIDEKAKLEAEKERIESILHDTNLLKKEIEKGLIEVMNKFGDARRTQIMNIESDEDEEPKEIKSLSISLTNKNNIYATEASTLYVQRRNSVGTKFKLDKDEYIISNITANNNDTILFFTKGASCNCYRLAGTEIPIEQKTPLEALLNLNPTEKVLELVNFNKKDIKENIIFITKKGMIKKTKFIEYNTRRAGGIKALELDKDDELLNVIFTNDENIGIVTEKGRLLICPTKDIRAIGRVTKGVKGIKLDDRDYVTAAHIVPRDTQEIISISNKGYFKKTAFSEFGVTARYTKGQRVQKLKDKTEYITDFLPLKDEKNIVIISSGAQLKVSVQSIPLLSKNTLGVKSIKLKEKDVVVSLSKE